MESEEEFSESKSEKAKTIKKTFTVPSYYKDFSCKCGDCRTPCCSGWSVTVSMREYFELLSLDCSDELRRKIDCALTVISGGNENEYARLTPSWLGTCHLQREDGLCAVHAECGELSLPSICRAYPRCARGGDIPRLCCSASCEKTVELFMEKSEPITFELQELDCDTHINDGMTKKDFDIQKEIVKILQNRELIVGERLFNLYTYMLDCEPIRAAEGSVEPLSPVIEYYAEHSDSISALCEKYESVKNEGGIYDAIERLYAICPDFDVLLEHLLVNHVFYSAFPIGDERVSVQNAFFALCVKYALSKIFAAVAVYGTDVDEKTAISDAIGALYRLCEHSSFDYNCTILLKRAGLLDAREISSLILI